MKRARNVSMRTGVAMPDWVIWAAKMLSLPPWGWR